MIQPDRDGMVPCPCGAQRHFAKPCPHGAGPNPAVLPPPGGAVGASDAVQRRMEADGARTAASGLPRPRTPHGDREWGGS